MRDYLFSFLQRRNPEKPSNEDSDNFFVKLSAALVPQTHYYTNLNSDTFTELRVELIRRSSNFSELLNKNEVIDRYSAYHDLYRLINRENVRNSFDALSELSINPEPLSNNDLILLWDHIAHYLWVTPDEDTISDITSILIAHLFWRHYKVSLSNNDDQLTTDNIKNLQRIARHAKVVISIPITRIPYQQQDLSLSRLQIKLLQQAQDGILQQQERERFTQLARVVKATAKNIREEKLTSANEAAATTEALIADNLSNLSVSLDSSEIRPLLSRFTEEKPTVSRVEISDHLTPEDQSFLNENLIQEDDEESDEHLQKRITAKLNEPIKPVKASLVESVQFDGITLNTQQSIPEGSWFLRAKEITSGSYDYYLTYYWGEETQYRLLWLTGNLTLNDLRIGFELDEADESVDGFQHYKLTSTPLNSNRSSLITRVALNFTVIDNSTSSIALTPFDIVSTVPRANRLDIAIPIVEGIQQPDPVLGIECLEVADFRRVEQEVACYIPAEVARIENILASEYREKSTRNLLLTETETELSEEAINEYLSDTAVAEKYAMQSEISATITEENSRAFDFNTGVQGGFGPSLTFSADASASFNNSSSKTKSNSNALSYSQEITRKTQEKIVQKRTSKRRALTRKEFEEINKHGFDNKNGQEHVVGIYRYVDLIMDNYLVNYGKRLMFCMYIPEPAINYIWSKLTKAFVGILGQEPLMNPKTPGELGLNSIENLDDENYITFASEYRVDVSAPPTESITVSRGFSREIKGEGEINTDHSASFNELEVPEGYIASHVYLSGAWDKHGENDNDSKLTVSVGEYVRSYEPDGIFGNGIVGDSDKVSGAQGIVPVGVNGNDVGAYSVIVTLKCELANDRLMDEWRLETYNRILDAYEEKKTAYLDDKKRRDRENNANFNFKQSPTANRAIEKQELKLSCIQRLTEPFGLSISEQHYLVDVLPPKVIPSEKLEKHSRLAEFLENAFDWNLMAYNFYPYYYLHKNLWYWRMEVDGVNDPLFESFLTAGFAKIVLPVKREFETQVMYFLETGEVWKNPVFVLGVKNDLYLAVADEMATAEEEVVIEDSWQTKLPTNLTILQKRAAGLDEEGLPCKEGMEAIAMGNSILQPSDSSDD